MKFLKQKDFKQGLVCDSLEEMGLVCFIHPDSPYCDNMVKHLFHAENGFRGVDYAICDVKENFKVIELSEGLGEFKLEVVPFLIFYFQGKPYSVYNNGADSHNIISYLRTMNQELFDQLSF